MDESKLSSSEKIKIYEQSAINNDLPKDAYLKVTEACNCKCVMCDVWKKKKPLIGKTETLMSIIKVLAKKGFNWVTLWGGEPYLHPEIIEIMMEVKKNHLKLQLITNGIFLQNDHHGPKLDATAELADNVVFSVDGPDAQTHDQVRGKPGAFEAVTKNMHALLQKIAKNGSGPGVEIDATIVSHNINVLEQMIEFSKQFGDILVDFDPAQLQGVGNSDDKKIIDISPEIIEVQFAKLIDMAHNGAHISSAAKLLLMKDYLLKKPLNGPCISLFKDLLLTQEGDAHFCWGSDEKVGNILYDDFKQHWQAALAEHIEAIDGNMDKCHSCGFSHVRWPDPNAAPIIAEINNSRKQFFACLK